MRGTKRAVVELAVNKVKFQPSNPQALGIMDWIQAELANMRHSRNFPFFGFHNKDFANTYLFCILAHSKTPRYFEAKQIFYSAAPL